MRNMAELFLVRFAEEEDTTSQQFMINISRRITH